MRFRELDRQPRRAGRPREHEDLPAYLHDDVVLPRAILSRLGEREREGEHLVPCAGHDARTILPRCRSRRSSTAIRGTTTRSRSCSPSRARSSSFSASRRRTETRRSRRRRRTPCASWSSSGARTWRSPRARIARSSASSSSQRTSTARAASTGPPCPRRRSRPISDDAIAFMAATCRPRATDPVTLVATGPLTNVARYLAAHGTDGIARIVLMGGAIAEGNYTPAAEFNIWCDPEAAAAVFASGLDVTMIGLDVTHQALLGRDVEERLRAAGRIGVVRRRPERVLHALPPRDVRLGRCADPRRRRHRAPRSARSSSRRDIGTSPSSSSRTSAVDGPSSTSGTEPMRRRTHTWAFASTPTPSSTSSSSGSRRSQ